MRNLPTPGRIFGYDFWIEAVVLLLMATGTVFVYSAGATVNPQAGLSGLFDFPMFKQLFFFPLAVGILLAVSHVDYHRFDFRSRRGFAGSLTPWLLALSTACLLFVLFFGEQRNQAKRWMDIMPGPMYVSFQPSELAKWVMIMFTAAYLDLFADSITDFKRRFLPICAVAALIAALIIIEDFGTAAFIALLTFLLLWIGGALWWHLLTPLALVIPGFIAAVVTSPTRINRIRNFFSSDMIPYQALQSLKAVSTGGLMGAGLGRGIFKYGHLPEDTTDFIFAVISEELGFIGAMWVLLLFVAFVILGIRVVMRCPDRFGKLLGAGIVLAIGIQAAINIGVVTVVLPTKGIPLPFISAGGTSLLLTAAATGLLLSIARQNHNTARPHRGTEYDPV